jgi:hypothetical protein
MLKINVLIKDLQSPKILCHSLQKKRTYLDTTSLIKLWKHSMQREPFNLAPRSSQKAYSTI